MGLRPGGGGVIVTDGMLTPAPLRNTVSTRVARSATSMKPPDMWSRAVQIGMISMARSMSQSLANCDCDSPSPPVQSPTTDRVKPTSGCSMRHASTILSSAALLTSTAARPGHGGSSSADRREVRGGALRRAEVGERGRGDERRRPSRWCRRSSARSRRRGPRSATSGPTPVAYTSASMPSSLGLPHRQRLDTRPRRSRRTRRRTLRPRLRRRPRRAVLATCQQRNARPVAGQMSRDAAPEPARRPDHHCLHPRASPRVAAKRRLDAI